MIEGENTGPTRLRPKTKSMGSGHTKLRANMREPKPRKSRTERGRSRHMQLRIGGKKLKLVQSSIDTIKSSLLIPNTGTSDSQQAKLCSSNEEPQSPEFKINRTEFSLFVLFRDVKNPS